jgi:hypothetical protein
VYVLLDDDRGRLTVRRRRPWERVLARSRAARLDRELAAGASPEANAALAARAARLTSTEFRRDLAASLRRILAAAGEPEARVPSGSARPIRVPVRTTRVSQSAPLLAGLASRLLEPGPVPAGGVAMVARLLADGTGPLYREDARDDLGALAQQAASALTWALPAQVGALEVLVLQQLGGRALEYDLPGRQDVAAVRDGQRHRRVLLHHQDRDAGGVDGLDDPEVLLDQRGRQPHRRLVHQQQARA